MIRLRAALCVALAAAAALQGCASPAAHCGLVACGLDQDALLQVTAAQLSAPPGEITLWDIQTYPGATVAWRARKGTGRDYQCREARDPSAPQRVKFVYCRPAT